MDGEGRRPGEPARRSAVLAWMRLMRVFQKINAASARSFRRANLSVGQFDVLAHLGAHEGITQQELAGSLLVTKGNISQLLERMESRGLVTRSQDGRCKSLRLSPSGRRLYRTAVPAQERLIERLFSSLSGEDQKDLLELLRRLDRGIRQVRPECLLAEAKEIDL